MEKHRNQINMGVEQQLHILFENRKHAKEYMAHKHHHDSQGGKSEKAHTPGNPAY